MVRQKKKEATKKVGSCFEFHKPIIFDNGMFKGELAGGKGSSPKKGYNIYVTLESKYSHQWNGRVTDVHYPITNMKAPTNFDDFDSFIDLLVEKIKVGNSVHVGCIGGHGRTGLVLAVLWFKLTGDKAAPKYIREHYCQNAIESKVQMDFLKDNYGMTGVKIKSYTAPSHKDYGREPKDDYGLDAYGNFDEGWGNFGRGDTTSAVRNPAMPKGYDNSGKKITSGRPTKPAGTVRVFSPTNTRMSLWEEE